MHRGRCDRHLVKAFQVVGDHARAEVIVLPQIQNLADHLPRGGAGRSVRRARPIVQAGRATRVKAPFPLVKGLSGDPEMATGSRHIAGGLASPLQHLEPPGPQPRLLNLRHRVSVSNFSTNEDAVDAAVPVDAQNAPTGTWKLQNSFHSANSAHLLFEKASTQTEESRRVNPVSGFHTFRPSRALRFRVRAA